SVVMSRDIAGRLNGRRLLYRIVACLLVAKMGARPDGQRRGGILDVTPAVPANLPVGWLVAFTGESLEWRTGMASAPGLSGRSGVVRIANCSGFYCDRLSAMREMLTGGDLDYVTGDYLAELTMLILGRDRMKHPERGYAKTFLTQLEECLGLASDRGVRIVANAGGLNPAGLADAVRALAERLGVPVRVAHVDGDDLSPRAEELGLGKPLTANAYLGAWGIVDCLNDGADIVVTGRVTDASVTVGPAAAHFGWRRTDYDRLAGAVVAGHVVECGIQATGGNYSFFTEVPDLTYAGFPLAEVHADG